MNVKNWTNEILIFKVLSGWAMQSNCENQNNVSGWKLKVWYKVNVQARCVLCGSLNVLHALGYCYFYRVWEHRPCCCDVFIHDVLEGKEH
jgi:hypothetical protein